MLDRLVLGLVSAYLRLSPFELGRWRLVKRFLPLLRVKGASLGDRTVRTRYHFRMKVSLADWLGQYVYLTGGYEPATAKLIAELLEPGDTAIDIGANAGFFTLLAATRVGPSGSVHAFEPIPAVREVLQANLALNNANHVSMHAIALSDADGTLTMYEGPSNHRGLSSLNPIDGASRTHAVEVQRLDNWLPQLGPVKLVKIDIEGAEQNAIEGMCGLLQRDAPQLVVEITDGYLKKMGHSATSLFNLLTAFGYLMFRIDEQRLTPIKGVPVEWEPQFNALFCHRDKVDELKRKSFL